MDGGFLFREELKFQNGDLDKTHNSRRGLYVPSEQMCRSGFSVFRGYPK